MKEDSLFSLSLFFSKSSLSEIVSANYPSKGGKSRIRNKNKKLLLLKSRKKRCDTHFVALLAVILDLSFLISLRKVNPISIFEKQEEEEEVVRIKSSVFARPRNILLPVDTFFEKEKPSLSMLL